MTRYLLRYCCAGYLAILINFLHHLRKRRKNLEYFIKSVKINARLRIII